MKSLKSIHIQTKRIPYVVYCLSQSEIKIDKEIIGSIMR